MKNIYLFTLILFCSYGLSAQVFFTESFEANNTYTGGSGGDCGCITATANANDGQNDYFARSLDADISANTGNDYTGEVDVNGNGGEGTAHYWAGEDIDDGGVQGTGNPEGCLVLSVNIAGRANLGFAARFGAHSVNPDQFEFENHMQVDYQIDGGGFIELLDFREDMTGATMSLDEDGDDFGDGNTVLGQIFSNVAAAIPGTGTTLQIQICMHSNTSSEEFAVDFVRVREIPLPVDLTKFSAYNSLGSRDVTLDWETASETNNDYFNIQRSTDGINFENIHRSIGYGTSNINHKYQYIDKNVPLAERLYYRLEQVDFDGTSTRSDIEVVTFKGSIKSIKVYPNPTVDLALIDLGVATEEEMEVGIFNSSGQLIRQAIIPEGSLQFRLETSDLPNGNYLLRINTQSGVQSVPILKMDKK